MKKKGLIISTVVMAVVLIASLTTATYAWFAASADVKVDQMTISVAAASDVMVGILTDDAKEKDADEMFDNDYVNGTVEMNGEFPDVDGNGLGTQLTIQFPANVEAGTTTGSEIALTKAVATDITGSFVAGTTATASAGFNPTEVNSVIFTANSAKDASKTQVQNDTNFDVTTTAQAVANKDYIFLPIGVRAAKKGIESIDCTITITLVDTAENLKDNAALHFYIVEEKANLGVTATGGESLIYEQEIDVFGNHHNTTMRSNVTGKYTCPTGANDIVKEISYGKSTDGKVTATFTFTVASTESTDGLDYTTAEGIKYFELYAYVYGPDGDCTSAGTGTSVKFDMAFTGNAIEA